jgi:hypothetical protein
MSRPRHLIVKQGNSVVSVSPKSLRAFLAGAAAGTPVQLDGKVLGESAADLTTLDATTARAIMGRMFPEPAAAPEASAAVVVATVSASAPTPS